MKKLVVVADDFGLCKSVNEGIVKAYQYGIVTEVSLMVGSPGTDDAIKRIKKHGIKNVGLHLLLKYWRNHGDIFRRADYINLFESMSGEEIQELFTHEIAEFEKLVGHKPTHITSQYGIVVNSKVNAAAVAYATAHNIPMRLPVQALYQDEPVMDVCAQYYIEENGVRTTHCLFSHIIGDDYAEIRDAFLEDLASCDCESVEFILHPGENSRELERLSSLAVERERDLKLALDKDFKERIQDQGYTICPYREAI